MGKCMSRYIPEDGSLQTGGGSSNAHVDRGTPPCQRSIFWKDFSKEPPSFSHVKRSSSQSRATEIMLGTPTFLTRSKSKRNGAPFLLQKSYSTKETVHALCFPGKEIAEAAPTSGQHSKLSFVRSSSSKEGSSFLLRSFSRDKSPNHSHWVSYGRNEKVPSSRVNSCILTSPKRSERSHSSVSKTRMSVDAAMDYDSPYAFMKPSIRSCDVSNTDQTINAKLSSIPSFSSQEAYDPPPSLESSPSVEDNLNCKHASEKLFSDILPKSSEVPDYQTLSEELSLTNCSDISQYSVTDDRITEAPKDSSLCMPSTTEPELQEYLATASSEHMRTGIKSADSSSEKRTITQPSSPSITLQDSTPVSHLTFSEPPPDCQSWTTCLLSRNQKENLDDTVLQTLRKRSSRRREALSDISSLISHSFSNCNSFPRPSSSPTKKEPHSELQSSLLDHSSNIMQTLTSKMKRMSDHAPLNPRTFDSLDRQNYLEITAGETRYSCNIPCHHTEKRKADNSSESKFIASPVCEVKLLRSIPEADSATLSNLDTGVGAGRAAESIDNSKDAASGCSSYNSSVDHQFCSNLQPLSVFESVCAKAEGKDLNMTVTLPPSISKAFSIMEAVAELSASSFPGSSKLHKKLDIDSLKDSKKFSIPDEILEKSVYADEAGKLKLNNANCRDTTGLSDIVHTSKVTKDLNERLSINSAVKYINSVSFPDVLEILERKPRSVKKMALELASLMNLVQESEISTETDVRPVLLESSSETNYSCANHSCQKTKKSGPEEELLSLARDLHKASGSKLELESSGYLPAVGGKAREGIYLHTAVVDSTIVIATSGREQNKLQRKSGTQHDITDINESPEANNDNISSHSSICCKASKATFLPHEEYSTAMPVVGFEPAVLLENGRATASPDGIHTGTSVYCDQISPTFNFTSASVFTSSSTPATPQCAGASTPVAPVQTSSVALSAEEISEIWRAFEAGQA